MSHLSSSRSPMPVLLAARNALTLGLLLALHTITFGAENPAVPNGAISARSFVDTSQIVSKYTAEQYAHQSSLKIVKGIGYVVYQCNETTPDENVAGQTARLAIFNILNPTATARWIDVSGPDDSSNGITLTGKFVSGPMLHIVDKKTLRVFFVGKAAGDTVSGERLLYKDYTIASGEISGLHQAKCTIGKKPESLDLSMPNVQKHLDFLFGEGFGAQFARGISTACDYVTFEEYLYSTIQIK